MVYPSASASDSDNLERNVSDGVVSGVGRDGNVLHDSSDSYSIVLMPPLTTPIFDFHQVISTFKTTLMILALSLMKTSLKLLHRVPETPFFIKFSPVL